MNVEKAQRVFVEAAIKHGRGLGPFGGMTPRATNRAYDAMICAARVLRTMPDRGEDFYCHLLLHDNLSVRCSAAMQLLVLNEAVAIASLEQLASIPRAPGGNWHIAFNAEMVLREWEAGNLRGYLESL